MQREVIERVKQIRKGNVPLGYKRTKLGVLPSEWSICSIGECLTKVESPVNVQPNKQYTQIGIRSHGKGLFYKEPVSGKSLGNKSVFWIEPNCFVLNIVFAWEQAIGKTSQAEVGMIGSHRFPMYRPVNEKIDIDYLIAFLMTKRGKEILEKASPGGAGRNRTLGQARFMKSAIVCPPIEEQRRITAILSSQDMLIDKKEQLLAEKQMRKKYLMQQLLTGHRRLPGFSATPMKKSKLGLVPSDWRIKRLENIGEFYKGFGISKNEVSTKGRPCIRYAEIYTQYQELVWTVKTYAPDSSCKVLGGYGDVIFACSGETVDEIGKCVAYLGEQSIGIGGDSCALTEHGQNPCFMSYMLNSTMCQRQKSRLATGASIVHLHEPQLKKLYVVLPSQREQEAIAGVLLTADREINMLSKAIEKEKQKKKVLMQLLLTGLVRV